MLMGCAGVSLVAARHALRGWEGQDLPPFKRDRGLVPAPPIPEPEISPPSQPAPPPGEITKLRLVEVLGAIGKLREAYALLKLDAPIADLTNAELLLRERWLAAQTLNLLSPEVAPLLQAIGIEPTSLIR
jgi:hypothetical protein